MRFDYISQLISLVSLGTLGFITFLLSRRNKVHLFIAVGQDVFGWLTAVLASILVTRFLVLFGLFPQTVSRGINSVLFFVAVLGILWSVKRHAKSN